MCDENNEFLKFLTAAALSGLCVNSEYNWKAEQIAERAVSVAMATLNKLDELERECDEDYEDDED